MAKKSNFIKKNASHKAHQAHHKLFLCLAIVILMSISSVSAFEFDNIGNYDEQTRTMEIRNSVLGIPWFQLGKVADIQLLTPSIYVVNPGAEVLVAKIKINNYEDYNNFFKSIDLYDLTNRNQKDNKIRNIKYKYEDTEIYDVNDTIVNCEIKYNQSEEYNFCDKEILDTTHEETRTVWKEFNKDIKLPPGEIILGIYSDVYERDIIDWIPEFFGIRIEQWAVFIGSTKWVYYEGSINDGGEPTADTITRGQTFIVGGDNQEQGDFQPEGISVVMSQIANGGEYKWNIFNLTAGEPDMTKANCDTTNIDATSNYTIAGNNWYNHTMNNCIFLRNGTGYALMLWSPDHSSGAPLWMQDTSAPAYVSGSRVFSDDNGSSYTIDGFGDYNFAIWGVAPPNITVSLIEPEDGNISRVDDMYFNCTSEGDSMLNITLYINGTANRTSSNVSSSQSRLESSGVINNIPDGNYNWSCNSINEEGTTGISETRDFTVDTASVDITINIPSAIEDFGDLGMDQVLNWTINDPNLDSIWWVYNGTNTTVYGAINETGFQLELGFYNGTLWANDTASNINSSSITWTYKIFLNNQTFNNITTEGATETFFLNLTKSTATQVSSVNLIHNGTTYSFPYVVNGNGVISSSSIAIPSRNNSVNITFFWNINLADSTEINTTLQNQTIDIINMDNCTSFTNVIYNFTQRDEETQGLIGDDSEIEIQINFYDTSKTLLLVNFSQKFNNTNPVSICLEDALLTTVNYSSYVIVRYTANVTSINKSYAVEYYNILNQTIGNGTVPVDIDLYSLKIEDTTPFRLTFRDSSFNLAPDILVNVHRQYISDNDFKIVEIPLTDSNGQTILNLVRNDIIYNLIMTNENAEIIATFNSIKFFCQDFTIGECTLQLNADPETEESYDYNEEFDISISDATFNSSTNLVSIQFVTGDLQPKTVRMDIFRNNPFGNRSVCTNSLTAASGLLTCDVSSITSTDQFLFIDIYVNGGLAEKQTINLNASDLGFGIANGAFFAFLFFLFLICLFMEDKKILLISLAIGWVVIISLGLMNGKLIGFGSAGIWILVSIGIFIWKLNKEERP